MEICVQSTVDTLITSKNGYPADQLHSRDNATANSLDTRIRFLDIRDTTANATKTMSEQSEANKENGIVGKERTEIAVEVIEEKDIPEVLQLLKEFFFKDEPMNVYLDIGDDCKELEEYSIKSLSDNCSFKAVNSDGEIIGVFLNGIVKKPAPSESPESYADACAHDKFRKILKLMEYIDSQFNLFDLYPNIDQYMDGKIMAVNNKYRGYGIGGILTERTLEFMRANNIPIISIMCSSHYSARVCEKLNFKRVYALNFVDYVVNGENPILPASPHKSVQIYVQEI